MGITNSNNKLKKLIDMDEFPWSIDKIKLAIEHQTIADYSQLRQVICACSQTDHKTPHKHYSTLADSPYGDPNGHFINWLKKQTNNPCALNILAFYYKHPFHPHCDLKLSFEYFNKAANMGHFDSLIRLGNFYQDIGRSSVVQINDKVALEIYHKAYRVANIDQKERAMRKINNIDPTFNI